VQINHLTLSFQGDDAHLEEGFLKNYLEKSIQVFRIAIILGFVIYATFGILDAFLFPAIKGKLWFVRFVLVCPFGLSALVFSYFPLFRRYWQVTISLTVINAGLGIIGMMYIAPPPNNFTYYAGLILVLFYSYTVPRALFVGASVTGWILVFCYDILALFIIDTPLTILINNNFFFIGANLVGMIACYFMEYSARNNYWLLQRLEEEKSKVHQINDDLQNKNQELAEALENVKTLRGFIPICMHCKKIRDDAGYWNQLESYLHSHSEAQLSHCLCPECTKDLYPDIYEEIIRRESDRPT
jgi:hypothetical protein